MILEFKKTYEDIRGKIFFFKYGKTSVHFVEIKKGFARGGHYHNYDQNHVILSGKVEYRYENIDSKHEEIKIISAPEIITVTKNHAHLLIAIDDTLFAESFSGEYHAIDYPKYRNIVKEKTKT